MIKKLIFILFIGYSFNSFGQGMNKFGPVIDLGLGFYSKTSDSLDIKGGLNPSFGVSMQNYINYWFSLKTTATYAFKSTETTKVNGGAKDKLNGQFFDLCLAGRFSGFDEDVKALPYGTAGLGCAFNIVSKGQEKYMLGCSYKGALPYLTLGAGVGIKLSFFSEFDLSLNYNRYLVPAFTTPLDNKNARLNQVSLKMAAYF